MFEATLSPSLNTHFLTFYAYPHSRPVCYRQRALGEYSTGCSTATDSRDSTASQLGLDKTSTDLRLPRLSFVLAA